MQLKNTLSYRIFYRVEGGKKILFVKSVSMILNGVNDNIR